MRVHAIGEGKDVPFAKVVSLDPPSDVEYGTCGGGMGMGMGMVS